MKRYNWYVVGATIVILLLSACRKNSGPQVTPIYTDFNYPVSIEVDFPEVKKETDKGKKEEGEKEKENTKAKKLPKLQFNIDNKAMRVWNKVPLPYKSVYDSIDITITVSSEAVVRILNLATNKTVEYQANRKAQRIDGTGGKLKISVAIDEKPELTYDMRILTYGYDPDKFTWNKETNTLPIEATNAKVLSHKDKYYWLASLGDGSTKLYSVDFPTTNFSEISGVNIPNNLITSNTYVDRHNTIWSTTNDGVLYSSKDLMAWQQHQQGSVKITQLVGEATLMDGSTKLLAVGTPNGGQSYFTYTITSEGLEQNGTLPEGFPIKEAFTNTHSASGISSSIIYSGITAKGTPALKSYFLSGSIHWGEVPYQKRKAQLPYSGGLFISTDRDGELFVIGGLYNDGELTNAIRRSSDRGSNWTLLPNQTMVGGDLTPRHHASGIAFGQNKSLEIYIFGGVTAEAPSKEIWHGYLDTTGGIINGFE